MIFKLLSTFTVSSFSGLWASRNSSGLLRHWPRSWHGEKCHVYQPPLPLFPILHLWIVRLSSVLRPSILANRHMLKDLWNTTVPRVSFSIFPKRHLFFRTLRHCLHAVVRKIITRSALNITFIWEQLPLKCILTVLMAFHLVTPVICLCFFFIAQINSHIIIVIFDYPTSKLLILNLQLIIMSSILLILECETTFELKLITIRSDNDII